MEIFRAGWECDKIVYFLLQNQQEPQSGQIVKPLNINMIRLNPRPELDQRLSRPPPHTLQLQSARYGDPHVHQIERVYPHHEGLYTCVVGNGEDCYQI